MDPRSEPAELALDALPDAEAELADEPAFEEALELFEELVEADEVELAENAVPDEEADEELDEASELAEAPEVADAEADAFEPLALALEDGAGAQANASTINKAHNDAAAMSLVTTVVFM